jgi:hypothetical protein
VSDVLTGTEEDAMGDERGAVEVQQPAFYVFVDTGGVEGMRETQISAYISEETREKVERYVEAHGVKKGFLIEEALLHHLRALEELPPDVIIPPRIVVENDSWDEIAERVKKPRRRTKAYQNLMAGRGPKEDP